MIKFMRRSYVFVIAWFLLGLSPAKSQYVSTTNSATSPLGKVSISSPTAAALGKYGDIPVGYHTGIPNVNIPVYTIKTGSLELPINLSYHAGGLKVQEQASWVGAGWALDAGGVITRTVMGAPDDRGLNANTDRGYFSDYGYANYLFSDGPVTCGPGTGVGCPTGSVYAPQDGLIQNGHLDGEPDLYFFNFNGHTGKFYFNDDRTPMLVPEQDLKITPIYPGSDVRGITGFIITTPDGVQYYFGKSQDAGNIDAVEVTYNVSTQALSNTNLGSTSSWFLNKIVSADNQFTINLIYQSEKSSYYTLSMFPVSGLPDPTLGGASNLEYDLNKNFVDGVRLNKITFLNGEVDFNTGNLRQDLIAGIAWRGIDEPSTPNGDAGSGPRVLDNITIQSTGFCKKFKLYTSYFYDPQALTGQIVTAYPNLNLTTDKYRLKLDQLQESSCDNSVAIPPYYFNYFSETVPRKLSFGIDHWGFYNGMTSNSSLIPTYSIPDPSTGNPVLNPGASRDAQWPAMRGGALQKITYPTGGSTVFDFEPNSVFTSNTSYGQRFIVGLSIHQTQYGQATSFSQTQPLPSASGQYEIVASNGSAFDSHLIITADANGATVQDIILRANTSYYNLITLPTASYHVNISLTQNGGISYAGGVQANFYQWQTTTTQQNVTVGGLRIKSITNNDAVTGTPVVTSYNYNFDNDNTSAQHSSGLLFSQPVYVQALRNDAWGLVSGLACSSIGCVNCLNASANGTYFKSPSSIRPMSATKGNHIGYAEVFVSQTGNGYSVYRYYDKNGSIAHKFDPPIQDVCIRTLGTCNVNVPSSPAAPIPYDPLGGELYYEANYRQDGQMLKTTSYFPAYTFDPMTTPGIVSKFYITNYTPSISGLNSFTEYVLQTARKTRDSSVTQTFDPATGNYATTVSGTDYGSKYHYGPTQTYAQNSKSETMISFMQYAADFRISNYTATDQLSTYNSNIASDESYLLSAIASLTTSPANAAQYKNERLTVYINYRYKKAVHRQAYITSRKQNSSTYASSFTSAKASADSKLKSIFDLQDTYQNPVIEKADFRNNKFLQAGFTQYGYAISPTDKVVPAKTQSVNLSQPTINFSYAAVNSNTLIQDSRYSDENFFKFYNGNLAEVTNRDGLTTSYIWGYTNTLPIVKAAGIDYATLKTAYDAVGGNLSTIKAQASLSKALVNTYVHTPLLGIITESDPNNKTINYDYDAIGRLKNIKDYQGNIVKNFQYNYAGGCGNNCVVLPMQTFMSYNTPSYPVGVFNSSKQYIGIANTPAEYVTLWNSNAANQAIGVLGTNADSLHFNLTFAANAAVPPVVYGLRYFQWDTYSPVNVRIATDTSTFIDWGDGNRQLVTLPRQQMREGIAYYHTNNDFMYYAIWLNHTYANSQPRTITVFHNETTEFVALTNDGINDAAGQDANIRGYYPEKLKGISLDQIPNSSDMGIKNFDKLTEIVNIHYRNFGTNTFRHNNYHTINHLHKMKWLKIVTRNGNEIFSDMATNFPNLVYVEFSDFKPDITGAWGSSGGFPNLHVLAVETSNTSTGSVTLTPAEIDAVIIRQAAVGVSTNGFIGFSPTSTRTANSTPAYNTLVAKGWTFGINNP